MNSSMAETGFVAGGTVQNNLSDKSASAFPQRIRPVWLASYPRSGNTFLRIILQNIFNLPTYSLYNIEGQGFADPSAAALDEAPILPRNWRGFCSDSAQAQTTLIKTHDPPQGHETAIYIVRDGRAAIDSYFHYHKKFAFEKPSLTEVIAGACQFGRWSEHFLAWQPLTRPDTLLLRYEDLVNRPQELIPQLGTFLGMKPKNARLPSFEELKQQSPVFFRRGQNEDFLTEWTPAQMALFNQLHGAVMEQLNYPLAQPGELAGPTTVELARSAARWHELYLENLRKLGASATTCENLYKEKEGLETDLRNLLELLTKKDAVLGPLLKSIWVKTGLTLGLLRRANKARRRLARSQATASPAENRPLEVKPVPVPQSRQAP